MSNVHYAKIGDVWKHLPLAEVLEIEAPRRYLESHAGSSSYPLTPSRERTYGVLRFASEAKRSPVLDRSAYRWLLARYADDGVPKTYPGSPLIAMTLLGSYDGYARGQEFVFCDFDGESLSTISEDARELGLPEDHLRLVEGDGIAAIGRELGDLSREEAAATFVHADPYQPQEMGDDGATSLDLLVRAAALGTKCMLWYGFDSRRDSDEMLDALTSCADTTREEAGDHHRFWFGEVSLRAEDLSETGFDPGVLGCGVVLGNVGEETLRVCARLGDELASIYEGARLPGGFDGSLDFERGLL
jgi:23S rRNA (adenine2030-N6)-methyltransferase